jgi:hypothetical protein
MMPFPSRVQTSLQSKYRKFKIFLECFHSEAATGLKFGGGIFLMLTSIFVKFKKKRMECLIALKLWTKIRKKSDFFR